MKLFKTLAFAGILALGQFIQAADTPETLEGCKVVTAAEVKALMDKGSKLFDVRVATEFAEEHIKGAVSLPYTEKSKKEVGYEKTSDSFDDTKLPASGMIFQCNGKECWKSFKACKWALDPKLGKKDLYWFRGGIPEWKAKALPVEK